MSSLDQVDIGAAWQQLISFLVGIPIAGGWL